MANKIVQLKDRNGDNLYPLSGGAGEGMITTPMLSDGAVTAEKIDLSTFGTVGTPTSPVYLDNGVPTMVNYWSAGDNWDQIPVVGSDGVMEIGGYLDFHRTANGTNDYDLRIYADEDQVLRTSGDIRTRNGNTIDTNAANIAAKQNNVALFRYQSAEQSTGYILLGTLRANSLSTHASITIDGKAGRYQALRTNLIRLMITNRDGLSAAGSVSGDGIPAVAGGYDDEADIVAYQHSDNSIGVYIKCTGYCSIDLMVRYEFQTAAAPEVSDQGVWTWTTTEPEGTKVFSLGDASTDPTNSAFSIVRTDLTGNVIARNVANKENKGTTYTFAIKASSWAALSDASPYTYSTTISIPSTTTVGDDTEVELLNDQPVLFATYGFAVAGVSGQAVTLYSVGAPTAETTIKLKVRN